MFSTFDLRLLLYVIRLAGWLKHCNLSLSLLDRFELKVRAAVLFPLKATTADCLSRPSTLTLYDGQHVRLVA